LILLQLIALLVICIQGLLLYSWGWTCEI